MTIQSYINSLNQRYLTGISREHAYRGDLQTLLTFTLRLHSQKIIVALTRASELMVKIDKVMED